MRKLFEYGGVAAGIVLIVFGVATIVIGIDGRERVRDDLAQERIVGTPDSDIPGQLVDTGEKAEKFAAVIRRHTLETTGGRTYAEMGRFVDEEGQETNNEDAAAKDPDTGRPRPNEQRDIWVTSTALSTALNTAYFAERVSTFAIVMGIALLLTGIGLLIMTVTVLRPALRRRD